MLFTPKLQGKFTDTIPPPLELTWQYSAYGEFEVTHDCSDITSANFLNAIGKKTKCLLRISTVGPERGSADTVRDVHGWAMKLYTEEGNLDWVFNNTVCYESDTESPLLTSHGLYSLLGIPSNSRL